MPSVWVHDVGCADRKFTLWRRFTVAPAYEKFTVPPVAMVTFGAPPSAVFHTFAVGEPTMVGAAGVWLSAGPPMMSAPIPATTMNGR